MTSLWETLTRPRWFRIVSPLGKWHRIRTYDGHRYALCGPTLLTSRSRLREVRVLPPSVEDRCPTCERKANVA